MIVITGATGLLGSVLAHHLISANVAVTGLCRTMPTGGLPIKWVEGDVTDVHSLIKCFEGASCVVHGAALVSFAFRNRSKMFHVNVEGTANVVNACLQAKVKRLVHISSIAALGKPVNQKVINEGTPWTEERKVSPYGKSKYLAELEVLRGEAEGLSVAIVSPSVILSNGNSHRSSGKIIEYVFNERAFYTDGQLNYVDARDVAAMVLYLCENHLLNGRYIANAGAISLQDFIGLLAKRLNKKPPYIKISAPVVRLAAVFEWIRCSITGQEPLITEETVRFAQQDVVYSNQKACMDLGMSFRELSDTIEWSCKALLEGMEPKV
jgi:dihydroflavonol-4-reductase